MKPRLARTPLWLALIAATGGGGAGCGAAPASGAASVPTAEAEARATARALRDQPFVLRFNPAPCPCPAFEVRTTASWLRAELDLSAVAEGDAWLAHLNHLADDRLPVAVTLTGAGDGELYRTWQGAWTARVVVQQVLSPLPPAPAAPPEADKSAAPATAPATEAEVAPER